MIEASQAVGLHDKQAAAADFRDSMQFASLADFVRTKGPAPRRPEILFVFSTNEALEVDAPNYFFRLHEVQCRKRNCNGGGPALRIDARLGSPHTVPT